MGAKKRKYTTITIPSPMYEKLSKMIANTGFSSVSDYVTYVVRELIAEVEESKSAKDKSVKSDIVEKLKALGYA
ncbi:MAG: ribbon-helix-helix domain-containing protein [Candidatus Micrarchaeia archaeon]